MRAYNVDRNRDCCPRGIRWLEIKGLMEWNGVVTRGCKTLGPSIEWFHLKSNVFICVSIIIIIIRLT